jgi:hypothetical protein
LYRYSTALSLGATNENVVPFFTFALPELKYKASLVGNTGTVGMWVQLTNILEPVEPGGGALFTWVPEGVAEGTKLATGATQTKMSVYLTPEGELELVAVAGGGSYGLDGFDTCRAKSEAVPELLAGSWRGPRTT